MLRREVQLLSMITAIRRGFVIELWMTLLISISTLYLRHSISFLLHFDFRDGRTGKGNTPTLSFVCICMDRKGDTKKFLLLIPDGWLDYSLHVYELSCAALLSLIALHRLYSLSFTKRIVDNHCII